MIPQPILNILSELTEHGFQAYLVGGCVRDTLCGRPISDWDITTSATPTQIMQVFPNTVPTGIAHGTVTVISSGEKAEVTTFRSDGEYTDNRHPKQVTFVGSLTDDLSRRDFTINAMAMNSDGTVIDRFGGKEDLSAGVIRCVGTPEKRFEEDALRMFRAFRFSAQLGFSIHPSVYAAVNTCYPLAGKLSVERIRDELQKILLSDNPDRIHELIHYKLLSRFGVEESHAQLSLNQIAHDRAARFSGLFVQYPKLGCDLLRLDKNTQHVAKTAADLWPLAFSRLQCKKIIASHGFEVASCYAKLKKKQDIYDEILSSGECTTLSQLAVSGKDLHTKGKQTGVILQRMLSHVLQNPEDNHKAYLLESFMPPKGDK